MAPIIASLVQAGLGILGSAVASKGKDLIQEKLGVNIEEMMGSQEGRIELLRIQTEHEEELIRLSIEKKKVELEEIKLDLEADKMAYDNTDSARKMQAAALAQGDETSKQFIYKYASWLSVAAFTYIFAITFIPIPQDSVRFADTILGFVLATVIATILNFFFGSSRQSKDKDTALAMAIKNIKGELK